VSWLKKIKLIAHRKNTGRPVAKPAPFEKPTRDRKPGSAKGKIIMADDFDAPLPDDVLKEFYK